MAGGRVAQVAGKARVVLPGAAWGSQPIAISATHARFAYLGVEGRAGAAARGPQKRRGPPPRLCSAPMSSVRSRRGLIRWGVGLVFAGIVTPVGWRDSARAQDGGPAPPLVCGASLTEEGACFGDTAAWCSQPNLAGEAPNAIVLSFPCPEVGGICVEHPAVGAWCRVTDGDTCAVHAATGLAQLICGDGSAGPGPGCDVELGCVNDAPSCTSDDVPACAGPNLVVGCSETGQALFLACPEGCADDACEGLQAGSLCDDDILRCDTDLMCVGAGAGEGFGRCAASDAGPPPEVPPSTAPPTEPSGCRCVGETTGDLDGPRDVVKRAFGVAGFAFAVALWRIRLFRGGRAWQIPRAG